jgi:hypothetical protein
MIPMRLSIVPLLGSLLLSTAAWANPIDVEFRSVVDFGGSRAFSLSTEGGAKTAWVEVGGFFAGYEVTEFRPDERVLILRKDGEEFTLALGPAQVTREDLNAPSAVVHASHLRQIGQASHIYAADHDGRLPGGEAVETIHDVARLLARGAGLNTASMWISAGDAKSGSEERLTAILDNRGSSLDEVFAGQNVVAFDFATGLHTGMPSTTPIAWTRGLRDDGTWDEQGVFGSSGGFVVFMGGNIGKYRDLKHDGEGSLMRPDGTRTSNILESLPPEARVVGTGPKTLHGASGVAGQENRNQRRD